MAGADRVSIDVAEDVELARATDAVRAEYLRRIQTTPRPGPDLGLFASRLREYDQLFTRLGLLPLGDRRFLDVGCANGNWLDLCCRRWGAEPSACTGVDLLEDRIAAWRLANPDSAITLLCAPAHATPLPPESFDVVHQSMMLSSLPDRHLREQTAHHIWSLLRPGGVLISYDFWLNPINPRTVGIDRRELRRLFPDGRLLHIRRLTLAPPLSRWLARLGARFLGALERTRLFNTHLLVALQRGPEPGCGVVDSRDPRQ